LVLRADKVETLNKIHSLAGHFNKNIKLHHVDMGKYSKTERETIFDRILQVEPDILKTAVYRGMWKRYWIRVGGRPSSINTCFFVCKRASGISMSIQFPMVDCFFTVMQKRSVI